MNVTPRIAAATRLLSVACLLAGFGGSLLAQDAEILPRADRITTAAPVPKKSPMASASIRTDGGYARVVYSQPMLRGREMIGRQVGYGKVWRAGANEATEIFTTADLLVGDKVLPAGAYSVFVVPEPEAWTLIFNRDLGQWGAYGYDDARDALRVEAPAQRADDAFEAFTIFFDRGDLNLAWGTTRVSVPVRFVGEGPGADR